MYKTLLGPMGFKKENTLLLTDQTDRKPTLRNIKWALATRKDDTVVIFFAGLGSVEADPRAVARDGRSRYLVAADTDPLDLYSTALPMDELQTLLQRYEAERVVVFLDASYSGAAGGRTVPMMKRNPTGFPTGFETMPSSRARAFVTSCRPNEISLEAADLGHGIFTYYLVEGLRGAADLNHDGIVTMLELYEYVEQQVSRRSRTMGGNQHPVLNGDLAGVGTLPLSKTRP